MSTFATPEDGGIDLGMGPAPSPGPDAAAASAPTVADALGAGPLGDFLSAPLPDTPMDALRESPLGGLLDTPLGTLPELPPLPQLPPLPPNPIEALLSGQGLAGLPGIDTLLAPLTELGGLFGSGSFGGGFDPTSLLQGLSGVLDQVMGMSTSALSTLDQVWQSQAAQNVQSEGRAATTSGAELSDQGRAIGTTTQTAAACVARGNANLETVASSFAATATAAAPVILTPPGQAMLLASAAEHLKAAIAIVTGTRTELNEYTLTMNGLAAPVPVPPPPAVGGVSPFQIANQVIEGVGKPLLSTVTDGLSQVAQSHATPSLGESGAPGDPARTSAAGLGTAAGLGGGGGGGAGGVGGVGGGFGGGGVSATPPTAAPSVAGAVGGAVGGAAFATGAAGMAGGAVPPTAGGGMMGGGAGASARGGQGSDSEHRSSPNYLQGVGDSRSEFAGDMPLVAPAVIGEQELDGVDFGE